MDWSGEDYLSIIVMFYQLFGIQSFLSLFFREHSVVSGNICVHVKPLNQTQNDVVDMPDQYVHCNSATLQMEKKTWLSGRALR